MMFKPFFFLMMIIMVCLFNRYLHFDPSVGETKPKIKDKATYPKIYVHGVTGAYITFVMWLVGLEWWQTGLLMVLAVLGYEWSQRFWNKYDVVSGLVGALLTYGLIYVFG